jgi:hypothetical protein
VFERILPAVSRPKLQDLVEEYSLWHVSEFSPPLTGTQALERLPQDIARLLTLEEAWFSEAAIAEILKNPIRYFDNDLSWRTGAPPSLRPEVPGHREVLEFHNVQVLDLRFFYRCSRGYRRHARSCARRRNYHILHDPYESRFTSFPNVTGVSLVRERINNSLTLFGDANLARGTRRRAGRWGRKQHEGRCATSWRPDRDLHGAERPGPGSRTETLEKTSSPDRLRDRMGILNGDRGGPWSGLPRT